MKPPADPAQSSQAVLGLDAAWTATEASGVALICNDDNGWRCVALEPSYASFLCRADVELRNDDLCPGLLRASERFFNGSTVTIVCADIPLATSLFSSRRCADDAVSKEYGAAGCGTHSPTANRPGQISASMCAGFIDCGYELATAETVCGTTKRLLEVYPHPALLRLLKAEYRIPYKVSKSGRYWPGESLVNRKGLLLSEMRRIVCALQNEIQDIPLFLPSDPGDISLREMKSCEDRLDALVCAWIGMKYLEGKAKPFGNTSSAIWIPT